VSFVTEAVSSSPLALPQDAWGKRRIGPRASLAQKAVAALFLCYGGILCLVLAAAWESSSRYESIRNPTAWLLAPEAILTTLLGAWVWLGRPRKVRRTVAALLLAKMALPCALLFTSWPSSIHWWRSLPPILVFTIIGVGVWRATEWGRRGCIVLGLAMYAIYLASSSLAMQILVERGSSHAVEFTTVSWFARLWLVLPFVALAIYGVLPSTRAHFAEARGEKLSA
jgi:peptidoglycan/LPS O-acetylase OafA/YrhL